MLVKITIDEENQTAEIDCPTALNDLMAQANALLDRERHVWIIPESELQSCRAYLIAHGHQIITPRRESRIPQPPQFHAEQLSEEDIALRKKLYAVNMPRLQAARRVSIEAGKAARAEWAAAHPGQSDYCPEANGYVMRAAQAACDAEWDSTEDW